MVDFNFSYLYLKKRMLIEHNNSRISFTFEEKSWKIEKNYIRKMTFLFDVKRKWPK